MTESLLHLLPTLIDEGRAEAVRQRADAEGLAAGEDGLLIRGDNLAVLAGLHTGNGGRESLRGTARLVYLDPPFDSKSDYRSRILTRTADGRELVLQHRAYGDRWAAGTADYLRMLIPRLVLAIDLLAEDGAILVHVDWHASHLVRLVLDELLGRDAFVNHLVWAYRSGGASRTSSVPRKHDDLLLYRRGKGFRIHPLFERQLLDKPFIGSKRDAAGRHYVDTILRDVLEGTLRLVDGDEVRSVSVRPVLNVSAERTGYATQKPEGLLEVLLRWTTRPGDLVVDAFAGSGTTAVAASRLGRRWVAIDANPHAIAVARSRLDALGAPYRLLEADAAKQDAVEPDAAETIAIETGARIDVRVETDPAPRIHLKHFEPAPGLDTELLGDAHRLDGDPHAAVAGWIVEFADGTRSAHWRTPGGKLATTITSAGAPPRTVEIVDLAGRRARASVAPRYDRDTQSRGRTGQG